MPSNSSKSSSAWSEIKVKEVHHGKYKLEKILGAGSYGVIFLTTDTTTTPHQEVAAKLENASVHPPRLLDEIRFLNILKGGDGIPKLQDLKPDNILIGRNDNAKTIFLIDYGLAKKYLLPGSSRHIPFGTKKPLTGTMRFASINAHLGSESSRRDDFESLGYVLLYLLRGGRLPWQGLMMTGRTVKEKVWRVRDSKIGTSLNILCKDLPEEFITYMEYCRKLEFVQQPDYNHLRQIFRGLAVKMKIKLDYVFDWSSFSDEVLRSVRFSASDDPKERNSHAVSSNTLDRDAHRRRAQSLW